MNPIQKNLFKLLVEFDEVCKKYNIDYILAAGAGLGAIRNHRFLPWDDDIDLYLTRENWEKLRHIVETEDDVLPEGRSLIYKENTEYYCNPLPRYVNNTTTTLYISQALSGKACGQHLELFIFDPMPRGEKEEEEYIKLSRLYAELVTPYFITNKNTNLEDWKKHYELYKKYIKRMDVEGEEAVLEELENKLHTISPDECDNYCMRWGIKVFKYDKKHFEKGEYGLFEGKKFPIGNKPEGLMRVAYGDNWMYVPEPEEQIVHNGIKYDDIPFTEFTKRYMKKINRESIFKKFKNNKLSNAEIYHDKIKVSSLIAEEKIVVGNKHLDKQINGKEDFLRSLLKDRKYNELKKHFKFYCELQTINEVKRYNLIVPISDENLATLLLCFIETGEYFTANKFLSTRKLKKLPITDELKEIEKEIDFCRDLSIARYDEKDEKLVQSLIDKYDSIYPNLLDIYRAKLWIKDNNAETIEDFNIINKFCDKLLTKFPLDGEIMAIQARSKLKLGNESESTALYKSAIENTRNGLIWQKVEDETGISRIEIERSLIEES